MYGVVCTVCVFQWVHCSLSVYRENAVDNSEAAQQPVGEWGEAGRLTQSSEARKSRSPPPRRRCVMTKVTHLSLYPSPIEENGSH